ncbi:hypothetical protein PIB30_030503 [Stylosanthes scabra]|uniref:Uncharacterized protein n=1 Tax=Stylosanthes scabra TaxID=79078 RepID=A0ABU6XBT4_9FABA|nr:hypothetical protein [Stylosanthes scabra]
MRSSYISVLTAPFFTTPFSDLSSLSASSLANSSMLYSIEPADELLRDYEDTMYRHNRTDHIAGRLGQLV